MPNLKIYNRDETGTTYLRLVERAGGVVGLVAVDAHGRVMSCGNILTITPDGKVRRISFVHPDLGFQLDSRGRVVFAE